MSLLDGKYEIMAQRPLGERQTLFEATAPDGTLLNIVWYDLLSPQEGAFEQYRRTLKRLMKSSWTALYDVVSRPGAHYVAWQRPAEGSSAAKHQDLAELLAELGIRVQDADIRRSERQVKLFGLVFGDQAVAPNQPTSGSRVRPTSKRKAAWPGLYDALFSWGLSALMVLVAIGLTAGALRRTASDRLLIVPDLLGVPVNDAARALYDLGFGIDAAAVPGDATTGGVVGIDPPIGSQLRPGRTVLLTYALASGQLVPTKAPQLVGQRYPDEVSVTLRSTGLEVGRVGRIAAEVPAGIVISQAIAAGSALSEGEAINILVSAGPQSSLTFIPDLLGFTEADARYLAEVAGLRSDRIVIDRVRLPSALPGTVVSQSLAPLRPVAQDAVLRLVVSDTLVAVSTPDGVPSFIGLPRAEAFLRAQAADLAVSFDEQSVPNLPEGVILQEPAPGVAATAITLTMNTHPVAIPTPAIGVEIRAAEPRQVAFQWPIESGIPEVTATVFATTLEGETSLVQIRRIQGGETLEGVWTTTSLGPITFELMLNDQPYGVTLRVP